MILRHRSAVLAIFVESLKPTDFTTTGLKTVLGILSHVSVVISPDMTTSFVTGIINW